MRLNRLKRWLMMYLPFGTRIYIPNNRLIAIFEMYQLGTPEFREYELGQRYTLWRLKPENSELLGDFGPFVIFNIELIRRKFAEHERIVYFKFWNKHDAFKFKLMV